MIKVYHGRLKKKDVFCFFNILIPFPRSWPWSHERDIRKANNTGNEIANNKFLIYYSKISPWWSFCLLIHNRTFCSYKHIQLPFLQRFYSPVWSFEVLKVEIFCISVFSLIIVSSMDTLWFLCQLHCRVNRWDTTSFACP